MQLGMWLGTPGDKSMLSGLPFPFVFACLYKIGLSPFHILFNL
jgi:hypothetical protein